MVINAEHISISLESTPLVHDVSFQLDAGERLGIVGTSGSGKSLLMRAILGLLPRTMSASGVCRIAGTDMIAASDRQHAQVRGKVASLIMQQPTLALNPVLTVENQVQVPLKQHFRLPAAKRRELVVESLASVGLDTSVLKRHPFELSGGQAQRVAIATALVTRPQILIADEPTTALDALVQREIVDLLVSLCEQRGMAMIFISHDMSVIDRACERMLVMDAGKVVEEGLVAQLLQQSESNVTRNLVDAARRVTLRQESMGGDVHGSF